MSFGLFEHDRARIIRPLPKPLAGTLVRVFGAGQPHPHKGELDIAQEVLANLRHVEHWLACGCRDAGGAEGPWPLLSLRRLPDGRVVPVRHGSTEHAPGCPLHRLRSLADEAGAADDSVAEDRLSVVAALAAESVGELPALASLLVQWLQACGYTRFRATDLVVDTRTSRCRAADVRAHYQQVDGVGDWPLDVGISVEEAWCNHLAGIAPLRRRLTRTGVLFGLVDSIEDIDGGWSLRHRTAQGQTIRVACETSPWRADVGDDGPWWVLATVPHEGEVRVGLVVAVPAFSRGWLLPLTDASERSAAALLAGQLGYWAHKAAEIPVAIERRLSPASLVDLESADFLVEAGDGHFGVFVRRPVRAQIQRLADERLMTERKASLGLPCVEASALEADDSMRRELTAQMFRAAGR
jgi:hypothetical protein